MNNCPKFYKNIWGDLQGTLNTDAWPIVTTAWKDKRYLDSFYYLLDYINPHIRTTMANAAQTEFKISHGSVIVYITITDDTIDINGPFVDISEALRIPLMRKVAELNFHPLTISQIRLNANQLSFYYSTPLDTAEPYKMYYVMKEICQTADRYDDEFREKFKSRNVVEPKIIELSEVQKEQAWREANEIINEHEQYHVYFESQRWYGSCIDFLVIALKRIDLCTQAKGYLKSEVDRVISELSNNNYPLPERIQKGRVFLKQIQEGGKDNLMKSVYQADVFIPEKWRSSADQVKTNIEGAFNQVQKYHNDKNYIGSVIESLYCVYDSFFRSNMDHAVNNVLFEALSNAAGKSWQESSDILLNGLKSISTIHSTTTV